MIADDHAVVRQEIRALLEGQQGLRVVGEVASVLDKLMLRDRTQVIIYALKRGLIRVEDPP